MNGKLIVFEGLDGSGKTTHTGLITKKLTEMGNDAKFISFPDYNEPSSTLVKMYLAGEFGKSADSVPAYAASTFYSVDRFASFNKFWGNDYNAGKLFIADRYTTSNIIHQMTKLPPNQWNLYIDWIEDFEYKKIGLPKPDAVFYLDLDPAVSQALLSHRYRNDETKKDIHESDLSYLNSCRETAFYAIKKLGWIKIDLCNDGKLLSKEENHKKILNEVLKVL